MVTILIIIGLSFLILSHEAGHFFVARLFNLKIDEFGFGFPPRIFARKKGETEYSLNWLPFGGFVKIAGEDDRLTDSIEKLEALPPEEKKRLFMFQPPFKRALVIGAGVMVNFIIGWFLVSLVFLVGAPSVVIVEDVMANSPAALAGIKRGDIIVGYEKAQDFINFINEQVGQSTQLKVKRGDQEIVFELVPRKNPPAGEGALGILLSEIGQQKTGFFESFWQGFEYALQISGLTVKAFYEMLRNLILNGSLLEGVVGPVGIFSVAYKVGKIGLIFVIHLLGIISLNLAVINLIPLPALDGGRLLLILIEKIKGSFVSKKVELAINGIGFVLLIFLMIIITIRDISKFF